VLDVNGEHVPSVNLSTVTAAVLRVQRHDRTRTTWTVTRSNQSAETLSLVHELVGPDPEAPPPLVGDLAQGIRSTSRVPDRRAPLA
jgi:hypothetical protein